MADRRTTSWIMGLGFLCLGTAVAGGAVLIHRHDTAFFAQATETTATVTDTFRAGRAHKRDRMAVRYAFTSGGHVVERSERWHGSSAAFRALSEGDEIRIAFIPADDPARAKSRLVTGGRQGFLTPMLVIGVLFAGVGGCLCVTARRS